MENNRKMVFMTADELKELIDDRLKHAIDAVATPSDDIFISSQEAAEILGITKQAVDYRRKKKQYKNVKKIGASFFYSKSEITRGVL